MSLTTFKTNNVHYQVDRKYPQTPLRVDATPHGVEASWVSSCDPITDKGILRDYIKALESAWDDYERLRKLTKKGKL